MEVIFSNEAAHVDISGPSGKGKTFLAKQIINQHPHIKNVFVFSRNHQDWTNPKDNLDDIQNTWNLYTRINKNKLVQECIVVFDDFNNEAGVNMWTNKTIKQMFTEGRKYGVYCILIHHSDRDTGNIARDNCYYKILFPKGEAQELHNLANLSMALNPDDVKQKYQDSLVNHRSYLLLKGRSNLQVMAPTSNLIANDNFKLPDIPKIPQGDNIGISSNVQNNGQVVNSTINMQSHSVHNNLIQANTINQKLEIQNIYFAARVDKVNKGLKIKELVRKHFISADDRDILILNLNAFSKGSKINYNNYKKASVCFCKKEWPNEYFELPDDSTRDTINIGRDLVNGDTSSVMNTAYNNFQPYITSYTQKINETLRLQEYSESLFKMLE